MKFILGTANGAVNGGSGGSGGDTIHQRSTVFSLEKKRNNVQDSDNSDFTDPHLITVNMNLLGMMPPYNLEMVTVHRQ